jgi:hypothetical protein
LRRYDNVVAAESVAAESVEGIMTFWLNFIGEKEGRPEVKGLRKSVKAIKDKT